MLDLASVTPLRDGAPLFGLSLPVLLLAATGTLGLWLVVSSWPVVVRED